MKELICGICKRKKCEGKEYAQIENGVRTFCSSEVMRVGDKYYWYTYKSGHRQQYGEVVEIDPTNPDPKYANQVKYSREYYTE